MNEDFEFRVPDKEEAPWIKAIQKKYANEERIVSDTGGAKGQKPAQMSLMPMKALMQVAEVYGYGAEKYDDIHGTRSNWRLGYDWNLSFDAAQRHMAAFWDGEDLDPESGKPHLAHAIFHMMALLTFTDEYPEGDNRWNSLQMPQLGD